MGRLKAWEDGTWPQLSNWTLDVPVDGQEFRPYADNGWHCTFFGGPAMIHQKISTYPIEDEKWTRPPYTKLGYIKNQIWFGGDLFGRYPFVPVIPRSYPRI